LRIKAGLASEEWFDVMPPADLAGWTAFDQHTYKSGRWERTEDGWLTGSGQSARLFCNVLTGNNFEMTGEFDFSQTDQLSILFGHTGGIGRRYISLTMTPKGCALSWNFATAGQITATVNLNEAVNTFNLQVWDRKVTLYINGQKVFDDVELRKEWWGSGIGQIGLGSYRVPADKTLRYRNLRLRRLTADPNPENTFTRPIPVE